MQWSGNIFAKAMSLGSTESQSGDQYCVEDPNLYLQGTMRNEKEMKEHAYVVIEVEKCQESLR